MGLGAIPGASPFLPGAFFGEGFGVLLRSAARRACVLLSCRVGCVFPGWRAWWVGWRFGRLLRIFLTRCAIWDCCAMRLLAPSGSLCGVLMGVEGLVCVLGCLRRASPRGARAAWFLYVLWSRGVAWFLRWCYFVAIVAVSLVGCPFEGGACFLN